MLARLSQAALAYTLPKSTGSVARDFMTALAFCAAIPAGAVVDAPANQTLTLYPGALIAKAGQTWRFNGSVVKRADQVVANSVGITAGGAAYITLDSVAGFSVGMTVAACTSDRTTAWTANQYAVTAVDAINSRLYLGGSGTGWGALSFVNGGGSVASLPAGAKVFTAGYMFGTRHSAPFAATDTYAINIDPATLANSGLLVAGATLTGGASGDSATVVALGFQADRIFVTNPRHGGAFGLGFTPGEQLSVGGTTVGTIAAAYVPGVTKAIGARPFPGIRLRGAVFDGSKSTNGTGCRWEYQSEIDFCSSDSAVSDVEVRNAIGEGLVLSGRHIDVRNFKSRDSNGNGLHFSDFDGVTGCWDVMLSGLDIDGACKDAAMGHNDGCVTYSNNTRNIRAVNFALRNSGGYGLGAINSYDNSETSWLSGTIENCALGPWFVQPPAVDSRAAGFAYLYDVKIGPAVTVRNCGSSGLFGGGYSGEANPQSKLLDCRMQGVDLYETAMIYGPFERTDVTGVRHYSAKGFGSTNAVALRGATNSTIAIDVIDETTGNTGVYQFSLSGNVWDNVDMACTSRGGARGFYWGQCSSNLATGVFRSVRSRNRGVDNWELGHMYNQGDYASDSWHNDSADFLRGAPPPNWLGLEAFNPTTKTAPGRLWLDRPAVSMPKAQTGSGGVVNFTVAGGVVNGVTLNTAGSSYPATGIRFLIASPNGKPAIVDAAVTTGALSGFTIVDGGSGYTAGGAQNVGCSGVYPLLITSSQQNIDVFDLRASTNGARPPVSVAAGLTNVEFRQGYYDNAGWSVPSTGARFTKGYTPNTRSRAVQTVTASPCTFTNTSADDMVYVVSGGTVSLIEIEYTQGALFDTTGLTAGTFHVPPNGQLRVTYSAAPAVTRFAV